MFKEKIIDISTGKEILVDYSAEQMAEVEMAKQEMIEREAEWQNQKSKRESAINKLIDLGLTEEEAKAFLG